MYDTLLVSQIKIVLDLINLRRSTEDKAILRTLKNKYNHLLHAIERDDDLKKYSIRGSVRVFLEAYNNYEDPLITELYKAEQLYITQLNDQ
ncbi:MAG: hypothetical protein IJQ33_10565 [Clostridia bacterium]|nr:hypothetical protein [Clostridia bacterium]